LSRFTTLVVLLGGVAILLLGNGLFGTLLGIRANIENFGAANTGLIMSAYFLGYAVGSYLCVQAINGVGHIRTFAALSATLAATAIAHAIFVDPVVWGVFRLVAGVCIVGVFLVIESWLNFMTPPPMRGRVFSIYMMVNLLAMASGQFLLMVASPGDFVLFGVVSILFALSLLPTSLARIEAPPPQPASRLTLRELYAASPLGVVGCLASGFAAGAFWGMGPVFANSIGLAEFGVASFMSAVILGGMAAQWPIGSLSDRIDRRKVIIATAALGAIAAGSIALSGPVSLTITLILSMLFGASLFPLYSLCVARTLDVLDNDKVLEATRGLILLFGIGAVLGPIVSGWSMGVAAPIAMFALLAAVFTLLTGFAIYRKPLGETVATDEQSSFVPMLRTSEYAIEMAERPNIDPDTADTPADDAQTS